MASWADIQGAAENGSLERLDTHVLEEYLRVTPPNSASLPVTRDRFETWIRRIERELAKRKTHQQTHDERSYRAGNDSVISVNQSGGITAGSVRDIHYHAPQLAAEPKPSERKPWWKRWWAVLAGAVAFAAAVLKILDYFEIKPHTVIVGNPSSAPKAGSPPPKSLEPVAQPIQEAEPKQPATSPTESKPMFDKKPDPQPITKIETGNGSVVSNNQQGGITVGTINVNAMQPQVEGVRIFSQQIASPREDAPYAIQITVQVAGPVQPFGLAVVCDREIVQGSLGQTGNSVFQNVTEGFLNAHPKTSYYVAFRSPAVTPSTPLLVTIMCKEPFNILSVQRMNL